MSQHDEDVRALRVCADCHAEAPKTNSEFTLISSRYGWRLAREVMADGHVRLVWRCPTCWEKFKKSSQRPTS